MFALRRTIQMRSTTTSHQTVVHSVEVLAVEEVAMTVVSTDVVTPLVIVAEIVNVIAAVTDHVMMPLDMTEMIMIADLISKLSIISFPCVNCFFFF
jgi:hypothetical protein